VLPYSASIVTERTSPFNYNHNGNTEMRTLMDTAVCEKIQIVSEMRVSRSISTHKAQVYDIFDIEE
jgi:hypothetical protein